MGWRTRAYSPLSTRASPWDGRWVRRPSCQWPRATGIAPAPISSQPRPRLTDPGSTSCGAGLRQASTRPRKYSGMPSTLRKTAPARRPPRSPQRRDQAAVKALAPAKRKPANRGSRKRSMVRPSSAQPVVEQGLDRPRSRPAHFDGNAIGPGAAQFEVVAEAHGVFDAHGFELAAGAGHAQFPHRGRDLGVRDALAVRIQEGDHQVVAGLLGGGAAVHGLFFVFWRMAAHHLGGEDPVIDVDAAEALVATGFRGKRRGGQAEGESEDAEATNQSIHGVLLQASATRWRFSRAELTITDGDDRAITAAARMGLR